MKSSMISKTMSILLCSKKDMEGVVYYKGFH